MEGSVGAVSCNSCNSAWLWNHSVREALTSLSDL
jgi:hypothetical protein